MLTAEMARPKREKKSKHTDFATELWPAAGVCVFLVAIIWIVFGQTTRFPFINFDDPDYVYKNADVTRGLSLQGVIWAFTHLHAANWHPLTWISHMLDCQLYGLSAGGHHLTNIILHSATAVLLFLTLRQMTGALWRSAFVAAVFAVHPLRVESVAWVSERKDVLSALFFVLTIAAYSRYARSPSIRNYTWVFSFFALGLMCKPMLVTLPLVLLLLDYWPLQRCGSSFAFPRNLLLEKLPLLGLATLSCLITLLAQQGALQPVARIGLLSRLGNAAISYVDYLRQMFWPVDLAVLYPWDAARITITRVSLSLLLLTLSSAMFLLLPRRRYLIVGWKWYLLVLAPVIGILQVGNQARADRYTYLSQIGLYILLTWTATDLLERWSRRHLLLGAVSAVILAPLLYLARVQASYWQDSRTLWSHALACTTDNTVAEGNLGMAYYTAGNKLEAMAHFQQALRIEPRQAAVLSSLGVFYLEMGRPSDSLTSLQRALEIEPQSGDAHYNIANTYLQMRQAKEAIMHYGKALEIDPHDTQALNNMAWVLATSSDALVRNGNKAVELAESADLLTNRRDSTISATLAAAYAEAGRFSDAVEIGQRATQLATGEGNSARANSIRAQVGNYQSSVPFRANR